MQIMEILRPVLLFAALTVASASKTGRTLRRAEPAVESLDEVSAPGSDIQEKMLAGTMGSLLQSEAEVMDPKSPKAQLQRKLVALIWLERVLQQNLDSMNKETYREKIAESKTGLEKDTTPATAEMLSRMRTEMHEFSVPFFQNAVKDELKDIRARQKALLDKIIALDAGEDAASDADSGSSSDEAKKDGEEDDGSGEEKEAPAKKVKKKSQLSKADEKAAEAARKDMKKQKREQSNLFVLVMSAIGGTLILIVIGIAIKVHTHQSSRA